MKTPHVGGMQFGLWVEPEMVNPDSDLYRAHPDWILAAGGDQHQGAPGPGHRPRPEHVRSRPLGKPDAAGRAGGVTFWRA
jgi:hypothetical protein